MPKPILSIITAMDRNQLIGKNNELPWHLPEDLAFFKKCTMNKPIIMGRNTFESIGRPLPGRTNIIISRNKDYLQDGCVVLDSIQSVLNYCKDEEEIMLIGGESLYKQWLPFAHQMYITEIDDTFEGDAWFPEYDKKQWIREWEEANFSEKSKLKYAFVKLKKNSL
ncbi:MAG: dihydrofolate reductase [Gammaproteobacteria bacterium]|nr:dihydrofolate reductase [Gammaproteobacteria bacterium]